MWNELTILWNDLTTDWNDLTWNDLTMERNDRIPARARVRIDGYHDRAKRSENKHELVYSIA